MLCKDNRVRVNVILCDLKSLRDCRIIVWINFVAFQLLEEKKIEGFHLSLKLYQSRSMWEPSHMGLLPVLLQPQSAHAV
jgi:hypothetical protein